MAILGIITALLPVVLKIVEWFLDRAKVSAETKKLFFEFVKKAGSDMGSAKLMEYGDAQLKFLEENPWQESN